MQWVGQGVGIFTNQTTLASVKWVVNKFIAFSSGTNTLAYSYDGIRWLRLTNSTGLFSVSAYGGDCSTALPHSIIFPSKTLSMGTLISQDDGATWPTNVSKPTADVIGNNGRQYIFASSNSNGTVYVSKDAMSPEYATVQLANGPNNILWIVWNGTYWLMGGSATTSTRKHLLKSYDGFNWSPVNSAQSFFAQNDTCVSGVWNGERWVVSGLTSDNSATIMLYSSNGETWAQSSSTYGGGVVAWDGSIFLCGNGITNLSGNTIVSKSAGGVHWEQVTIGAYNAVETVITNGSTWVVTTTQDGSGVLLTSVNGGSTWTADTTIGSNDSYLGGVWTGSVFAVNTTTNAVRISSDGLSWTTVTTSQQTGKNISCSNPEKGIATIQQPTIVGGVGANHTMAYSLEGVLYRGIGNSVFSQSCNAIHWNGRLWVAGGIGTNNTLAYSYDGIRWIGLGTTVFSQGCYGISHNSEYWVAVGSGGNTIATSTDGKSWSGVGTSVFDGSGVSVDWNGVAWVATGNGANTLAVSSSVNASSWSGLGNATFSSVGTSVRWMMNKWVATGTGGNTIAVSDIANGSSGWSGLGEAVFSTSGSDVCWNGSIAVAVGSGGNTIATSTNGTSWVGKGQDVFYTAGTSVVWNTQRWVATGTGGNTVAYSYDGNAWSSSPDTNTIFSEGRSVGTNSRVGVSVADGGLYLKSGDKLSVATPAYYDSGVSPETVFSFQLNL